MSKRNSVVPPARPDLEAAVALEVAANRFREGEKIAMLEAGRIALWYMETLGYKPAAKLRRALELAVDRWSTGCMRPRDSGGATVLCIGEALGIPHRTRAPGVSSRIVIRDNRSWRVEWWIWHRCWELAPRMKREDAFAEIARDLCIGVETVKRTYTEWREALRAFGHEPLPWPRKGRPFEGLVRLRSQPPPSD